MAEIHQNSAELLRLQLNLRIDTKQDGRPRTDLIQAEPRALLLVVPADTPSRDDAGGRHATFRPYGAGTKEDLVGCGLAVLELFAARGWLGELLVQAAVNRTLDLTAIGPDGRHATPAELLKMMRQADAPRTTAG